MVAISFHFPIAQITSGNDENRVGVLKTASLQHKVKCRSPRDLCCSILKISAIAVCVLCILAALLALILIIGHRSAGISYGR